MNKEKTWIRLGDIIYSVFDGKWIVIAFTIIGLLAGILISSVGFVRGEMSKQYKIEASVLVSSQVKNGAFSTKTPNPVKDDITLAKELTEQVMYILKSDRAVSTAVERLGMVGVSSKSIQNNLTLSQYNESQIIEISLLWRSKDEGVKFLKTLEETTNEIMLSTLQIGKVVSVNEPTSTYMFGGQFSVSTWLIFALAGAVVGAAVCVLRRLLHPTLIWPEDLEEFFELEVLEKIHFDPAFALCDPFMIHPDKLDAEVSAAAYILLERLERANVKRLYMTSARRKEGKTTLLADLAVKFSEIGKRVLLVDCNFSNPALAPLFHVNLRYENTLNALYNGDSDVSDAITRLSGGLHLLPYMLEEKAELLTETLLQVIDGVAQNYDLVLIDAPPVGENAEALRLNKIADAALFLVRFDETGISEIDLSLTRLRKSDIPVVGAIVNGVKPLRSVLLRFRKKPGRFFPKRDRGAEKERPRVRKKKDKTEINQ